MLASPNNILAIEYLNAISLLESSMVPIPLLRKGKGYHDTAISEGFCSASAIRKHLQGSKTAIDTTAMPESALQLLTDYPHAFYLRMIFPSCYTISC